MIGKLLSRNVSVPGEAEVSTQALEKSSIKQVGENVGRQLFGIASTTDRFEEELRQPGLDLSKEIDLDDKSVSPYPGEEWFWQTPNEEELRLTTDQFQFDELGHLTVSNIESLD